MTEPWFDDYRPAMPPVLRELDFQVSCSKTTRGQRCNEPATHFVEVHQPGLCGHPALNDQGNLEKFVCPDHLKALVVDAERVARKHQPLPFWLRWFRDEPTQKCSSCFKGIFHAVDVLQIIVELPRFEGRWQ